MTRGVGVRVVGVRFRNGMLFSLLYDSCWRKVSFGKALISLSYTNFGGYSVMAPNQAWYSVRKVSKSVHCITENDEWNWQPQMYLISQAQKGCASSDLR